MPLKRMYLKKVYTLQLLIFVLEMYIFLEISSFHTTFAIVLSSGPHLLSSVYVYCSKPTSNCVSLRFPLLGYLY